MPDVFKTDQAVWYNNGVWGQLGFAAPNFGNDGVTNNATIDYLVQVVGRNLQAVMCSPDADLRTPPRLNTITRIHKLVIRARQIIGGRAVPSGTPDFESVHVNPGLREFLFFPCPYFKVRNPFMKEYCGLVLACLSEMTQATENRKPNEISDQFGGLVGSYLNRVYKRMCTELLMIPASGTGGWTPEFVLTDAQLAAYKPEAVFTSTEMIDTVPPVDQIWTEDDLEPLSNGIYSSQIKPFLQKFPGGASLIDGLGQGGGSVVSGGGAVAQAVPAFPSAPGP